ncbi:cupin domain-containing protein [Beijerinckia indica]|uniref:Bicupin, oxalate decarboxylase family n=1 Tax=Beijerinckia indica subsp. indica (strain ATCC 9039 / DSM 1715 / NCIMB 8712) TaxID=395963 RepID=B2II46_BEII9|nr:cupin domain-containing protein [Beijerinckia indica]ACB94629.1 bicupin, oxalate decarboxylase family [Beijerinckia indica subsp. indica ATCC 9039]
MTDYSRRKILAAGAAGGLLAASTARSAQEGTAYPSANPAVSYPGPHDPREEALNPSALNPLSTDHGNLGTLKFSFSEVHNRHTDAGWAREVTVRNFPASKAMAGVNMRLPKGAVRELHWHLPAEWAYVTYGTGRITAVDGDAKRFVADVKEGDLWFFPSGIPHSIQGLGPDGCEFVLVFNDGNFSEDSTFLISDWIAHTPTDILAKNFNLPESAFANIPHKDLWIFNAPMPGSLESDLAQSNRPDVPNSYKFALMDQTPIKTRSGTVRIADVNNFKASTNMSAALVEVEPGGMRELHWHPNSDEWQYYISGSGRMTVFANEGRANTFDFSPSDVGYVPRSTGHYILNTGKDTLRFLEVFTTGQYSDISLTSWMANTPHELVAAHLNMDVSQLRQLAQNKTPVVPA